jgi:hypothetical protein
MAHYSFEMFMDNNMPSEIRLMIIDQMDLKTISRLSSTCQMMNSYCDEVLTKRMISDVKLREKYFRHNLPINKSQPNILAVSRARLFEELGINKQYDYENIKYYWRDDLGEVHNCLHCDIPRKTFACLNCAALPCGRYGCGRTVYGITFCNEHLFIDDKICDE